MLGRENVLGVGVSVINMAEAVRTIGDWIDRRERHYICVTGVHGIMECQRSEALRRIHNMASMVTPDGMPIAWLLRLSGHADAGRVCGPDLMPAVFAASEKRGDRHFLYGSTPQTLSCLRRRLSDLAPRANIVGSYAPPFRTLTAEEATETVDMINQCCPDIVWVGLSTPKQEAWMAEYRGRLDAAVLIGVGAAFDFTAGLRSRAPRFLRNAGLEWSYRLLQEPRRLFRRYLASNPRFLALICMQKLGVIRPHMPDRPIPARIPIMSDSNSD